MNQYSPSCVLRKIAIKNGDKTYHGSPCKNCHNTLRRTSCSSCVRCHNERNKHKLYDGSILKYKSSEKTKLRLSRWRNKNPEKVASQRSRVLGYQAAYQSGRRSKTRKQTPVGTSNITILVIYKEARKLTQSTGIPHEVDHIIPISKGGLHHENNLQILTRRENRQKGAKL